MGALDASAILADSPTEGRRCPTTSTTFMTTDYMVNTPPHKTTLAAMEATRKHVLPIVKGYSGTPCDALASSARGAARAFTKCQARAHLGVE